MKRLLNEFNINAPVDTDITILKKNNKKIIIIDSDDFYIYIHVKYNIFICEAIEAVDIYKKETSNKTKLINKILKNYIKTWNSWNFIKIKFKGKGYRIKRKKKNLKFFFWLSHLNIIKVKNIKLRRIGNYKYILLGINKIKLKKTALLIKNVRKNDLFTKRGMRFGRQLIVKKKTKKSAYMK